MAKSNHEETKIATLRRALIDGEESGSAEYSLGKTNREIDKESERWLKESRGVIAAYNERVERDGIFGSRKRRF